jgi:hypothetical protein
MKRLCLPFGAGGNEVLKITPKGKAPDPGQETYAHHISGLTTTLHHVIPELHQPSIQCLVALERIKIYLGLNIEIPCKCLLGPLIRLEMVQYSDLF